MPGVKTDGAYRVIRIISFVIIAGLFIASGVKALITGVQIDTVISGIFLAIVGSVFGANLWGNFIRKE